MTNTKFNKWFTTFLEEKEIDGDSKTFEIINEKGVWNYIPVGCVFEYILNASSEDQYKIKDTIVKIDFYNGDVFHFFKHIATFMCNNN